MRRQLLVHATVESPAVNLLLRVKDKCNTRARAVFQDCPLKSPLQSNTAPSYLWIPLRASWQVKREGSEGRTLEGNVLINGAICNNNTGRSGSNSFRYRVNLARKSGDKQWGKMAPNSLWSNPLKFLMPSWMPLLKLSSTGKKKKRRANKENANVGELSCY